MTTKESAPRRTGLDSHNRLFGEAEHVPATPKSFKKSSIPIGNDDIDAPKVTNGNGTAALNGNGVSHENGTAKVNGTNGHSNGHRGNYSSNYCFYFFLLKNLSKIIQNTF